VIWDEMMKREQNGKETDGFVASFVVGSRCKQLKKAGCDEMDCHEVA
jgi:hypothetical protein